jgi:glycosidase
VHEAWLKRFAFDAIRMDTVKHVDANYFKEWISKMRGLRDRLYLVGELLDENSLDAFEAYVKAGFDGLFHFPLRTGFIETFAKGGSVDNVARRMSDTIQKFGQSKAQLFVTLLDNHDVPRFLEFMPHSLASHKSTTGTKLA